MVAQVADGTGGGGGGVLFVAVAGGKVEVGAGGAPLTLYLSALLSDAAPHAISGEQVQRWGC